MDFNITTTTVATLIYSMNKCDPIGRNRTNLLPGLEFEGIPQTLILNLIAWLFLILLFTLLRQQAWDYGRLALVNSGSSSKKWPQLFYAHGNNEEILHSLSNELERNIVTQENGNGGGEGPSNDRPRESITRQLSVNDGGIFSWLKITWRLKKDQIKNHSGADAAHYLSFQEHLIIVMAVITFISIVIILPINMHGNLQSVSSFARTTIANVEAQSPMLWAHTIFAICFVPLVVLVMRLSSGRYAGKKASTKTIMITNIDKRDCNKATIQEYLQTLFPDIDIRDVQLAYNIKKLTEVADEYEKTIEARIYCEQHQNKVPPIEIRHRFGCKIHKDSLQFYKEAEQKLCGEVARLKSAALNDPLGIAFVTVSSTQAAKHVINYFQPSSMRNWTLNFSPTPSDINWSNLTSETGGWWCRWGMVNIVLFIVLFFLTTPTYVVKLLNDYWEAIKNAENNGTMPDPIPAEVGQSPSLLSAFLPTLLLWTFTALMPTLVSYSEWWLSHWTKSKHNYAVMTKTFGYLLFMILILPSLGFVSASAFLEWGLNFNETEALKFECVFLPDRGAFFVNYACTACLIGTALELIRFPDLIVYIYKLLTARSKAETPHIRKSIIYEFPFGTHYSWTILLFTMSTVYSLTCPLITPFVLTYLLLKHFNDKHNLYFVYDKSSMVSKGGGKIHSTAVTMTKFSVALLLIIMSALAFIRSDERTRDPRFIVLIGSLFIVLGLFFSMSHLKRCASIKPTIDNRDHPEELYVADVFQSNRIMGGCSPSHISYGSDSTTDYNLTRSSSDPNTPDHVHIVKS